MKRGKKSVDDLRKFDRREKAQIVHSWKDFSLKKKGIFNKVE